RDPGRRGVHAELQGFEVEPALAGDDDLAVEHTALRQRCQTGIAKLGEVALERLLVSTLEHQPIAVPEHERAEAVPLRLEQLLVDAAPPLHVTPATADRAVALDWFGRFEGAGLDGVMAKRADGPYEENKRSMLKVKHERDCDCVVAGFRWHKDGEGTAIGSLLLGLYDAEGTLHHVGVCASFTAAKRKELVAFLEPLRANAREGHPWQSWASESEAGADADASQRVPGGKSRWSQGKDLSWVPLRPELVLEVAYDHMQGTRFRHTAQFRRFRTDKPPSECTYAQLEVVAPEELAALFTK
ncbi:MAG: hypothetical protein EOP08_16200, partial [Proteobacteria bacterium]